MLNAAAVLCQAAAGSIPGLLNNGVPKSQERRIGAFLGPIAQSWANHNEAETRRFDGNARNGEDFDESSALTGQNLGSRMKILVTNMRGISAPHLLLPKGSVRTPGSRRNSLVQMLLATIGLSYFGRKKFLALFDQGMRLSQHWTCETIRQRTSQLTGPLTDWRIHFD
jgi:hypothetical protein